MRYAVILITLECLLESSIHAMNLVGESKGHVRQRRPPFSLSLHIPDAVKPLTFPYITLNHFYEEKQSSNEEKQLSGFEEPPTGRVNTYFPEEERLGSWHKLLRHVLKGGKTDVDQPALHANPDRCDNIRGAMENQGVEEVGGIRCQQLGEGAHGTAFTCQDSEQEFVIKRAKSAIKSNSMVTNELLGALVTQGVIGVVKVTGWCSGTSNHIPWSSEEEFREYKNEANHFGNDMNSFYAAFGEDWREHQEKFHASDEQPQLSDQDSFLILSSAGSALNSEEVKGISEGLCHGAARLAGNIVNILRRLAEVGVTYTDMKPGNICIDEEHRPTIIDLGGFIPEVYFYMKNENRDEPEKKTVEETAAYVSHEEQSSIEASPALKNIRALGITIANTCKLGEQRWNYNTLKHYLGESAKESDVYLVQLVRCLWNEDFDIRAYQQSSVTYEMTLECIGGIAHGAVRGA